MGEVVLKKEKNWLLWIEVTVVNRSFGLVFEIFGNEYDETRKTGKCENVGLIAIIFVWCWEHIRNNDLRRKQIWDKYA